MARKIIGVTVGTNIKPEALIEKTTLATQVEKNKEDIADLQTALGTNISELAELVGGDA